MTPEPCTVLGAGTDLPRMAPGTMHGAWFRGSAARDGLADDPQAQDLSARQREGRGGFYFSRYVTVPISVSEKRCVATRSTGVFKSSSSYATAFSTVPPFLMVSV